MGNNHRASESFLAHLALSKKIQHKDLEYKLKLMNVLRKRQAVAQHHDAITGTEK